MSPFPLYGVTGSNGEYIRLQEFQISIPDISGVSAFGISGNILVDQGDGTFKFQIASGISGPKGDTGLSGQSIIWDGPWSPSILYPSLHLVEFSGSSFISIGSPPIGTEPTQTLYWDVVAQEGLSGAQGIPGPSGATGATGPFATGSTTNRIELDLLFKETFNSNTYSEISRVSGSISQIDIWETSFKVNKLFTKSITRTSGNISQILVTDDQTSETLLLSISRLSGNINTITKTYN